MVRRGVGQGQPAVAQADVNLHPRRFHSAQVINPPTNYCFVSIP